MKFLIIAAASATLLSASVGGALAQAPTPLIPVASSQSQSGALPFSGAGDQQPGGLTARDVVGKRLYDADGNQIGQISGVSRDGASAVIRPSQSGGPTTANMAELSLGTGAHSVILGDVVPTKLPNRSEHSTTITSTTTVPPMVVLPPPQ